MTPAPAYAGAWIAPKGGQTISTEIAGAREEVFYSESSIYVEAPISADVSVVVAPWVTQDARQSGLESLRWEITLASKWAVRRTPHTVTALQGGLVWNSDPLADCAEAQAEVRWLGGTSLGGEGRGFANLELAERIGDGGCGGERLDATAGYRLQERWLGMAQLFVDHPRLGDAAVRAQISLVRFGKDGRGVQIGVRARIDGETPEPALVLGFWGDNDD